MAPRSTDADVEKRTAPTDACETSRAATAPSKQESGSSSGSSSSHNQPQDTLHSPSTEQAGRQPHDASPGSGADDAGADADADAAFQPLDGGWTAWSQVLAAHLINAMAWGYAASFGVYQLHYTDTLGLPAAAVSWIGSIQVFLTLAVCTVSGRLADAGHARATVTAGCALALAGSFTTSLASAYWQLVLAQGICTGLGLGLAFMPAMAVIGAYFDRNRPLALSIAAIGTSIGSLVFPATVHYLAPRLGFAWAVRCSAFVALVVCAAACLLLRPPCLPPRKAASWVDWAAFRELPYALFALGAFLNFYVLYFGLYYINSYARNIIGFSSLDSVTLLLVTNALGIPTRPLAGYVANAHLGPINVFVLATAMLSVMLFAWTCVASRTAMYAYSVLFGLAVGANQATFIAALAPLCNDPRKMGIRFGMVETLCSFASLAGPPTAGAIIDRAGGNYFAAQIWGGSVMAAAAVIFAAARVAATGWTWRVKI